MNIKVKASAPQGRDFGINHGAGKGDAPRNLSEKFRNNFDGIDWGVVEPLERTGSPGKWRKVYK